jgi:hypothetical protein
MDRSSLHVSETTRRRLARYKVGSLSYEAILNVFMNSVGPDEFKNRWRAAQRDAANRTVHGSSSAPSAAGEGMEKAFRLFELGRVDA